ncbi:MFS transporter [Nocardioides sp. YIM 152315]|uniref:MFS transporter n=1 Tax=Nocardioides sp. YIM 152315 TaxID=3031760 RepID=UPI0023DB5A69|nr:MFS transporter [Nocardioides sp. YIM 152315]MDF1602249.1 MFS transporter [Nocardioides sp. YIM 152315]
MTNAAGPSVVATYRVGSTQFVSAALVNFFMPLNFFMLVPITVLLAADRYGASLTLGGFAAGALLIGAVAVRPFVGILLRGRPLRGAVLAATTITSAGTATCLLPIDVLTFSALRFLSGAAFAVATTATLVIAVSAMPTGRRGSATGLFGLSNSLAAAVGPALGLFVARKLGYDAVLLIVTACGLLGTLAALAIPRRPIVDEAPVDRGRGVRRFVEPRVFGLCAVIALVGFAYAGLFGFMDAATRDRGLAAWAPWFFIAYSTMVILARPLTGRAVDRRDVRTVMLPAIAVLALGVGTTGLAETGATLMVAGMLCGLGMGPCSACPQCWRWRTRLRGACH